MCGGRIKNSPCPVSGGEKGDVFPARAKTQIRVKRGQRIVWKHNSLANIIYRTVP